MSSSRYWGAIVLAVGSCIALMVFLMNTDWGIGESIIIGLGAGALIGELIFWDTLPVRLCGFFLIISVIPIRFAIGMLCSGIIGLIIGIMIFTPCLTFLVGCALVGILICGVISIVCFPIHIFAMRDEIY